MYRERTAVRLPAAVSVSSHLRSSIRCSQLVAFLSRVISTGLWTLYGNTAGFPDFFDSSYRLRDYDSEAFMYESMRFFAPVVGFPWWTTPPARASDDTASQTEGGVRHILNLAMSSKDPNAWGPDAHRFKVRTVAKYHSTFMGFADNAYDNSVANGAMNRACPGKLLGIAMGQAWFDVFDQDAWCTNDETNYKEATPFVDEFTLIKPTCPGQCKRGIANGQSCSPNMFGESACCDGSCNMQWGWHNCGWRGCDQKGWYKC